MSEKKLRFLINTFDAFGTINPMMGLAKLLKSRGHQIIFLSNESFRQSIEKCGFIYEAKREENDSELSTPQALSEYAQSTGLTSTKSSIECMKIINDSKSMLNVINQHRMAQQNVIKKCIEKYNPDIILQNSLLGSADAVYSGLPWVGVYCESPINIYESDVLPPFMSGYATNSDPKEWKNYKVLFDKYEQSLIDDINAHYRENGFAEITTSYAISLYLNIYSYPKELDYNSHIVELPQNNWFRVDSFLYNQSDGEFVLPKQLENKSGKLIYVSMGTIGSINLDLMNRLLRALSKSSHRFIVSQGMRSSEYSLYDNMCGDSYLPQTLIIPKVDLVITHGGNNTFAESFYFGKPMIVMPLFFDHYDNAQRIHETGFGIRLNAHLFTESELLSAIETLLNDKELFIKLKKVAQRIKSDNSLEQAVKMIENLLK